MAVYLERKFKQFREYGIATKVEEEPIAKLMHYLHCVRAVLNVDNITDPLQNFEEYYNLSSHDVDQVLDLCLQYKPEYLEGKCFQENPELCINKFNNFWEISSFEQKFAATRSVVINSHEYAVLKVMVHKGSFYTEHYHIPMEHFKPWINAKKNNKARPVRKLRVKIPAKVPSPGDTFADNIPINVLFSYLFPVWLFVWIFMSSFIVTIMAPTEIKIKFTVQFDLPNIALLFLHVVPGILFSLQSMCTSN